MKTPDPYRNYYDYISNIGVKAGIPWHNIGDMTVEEISLCFAAHQDQEIEKTKILAWLTYQNALLVAIGVNNPKQFPAIEDAFPTLFEKKAQQDWWVMKQRVEDWAKAKTAYSA